MLESPYTPGDLPRVFVGRELERRKLRDVLARVLAYGEMGGPLKVVTGTRGLGKTSLLREVSAQAATDGFVVSWTSGVKQQPVLADLVDRVNRSLQRAEVLTGAKSKNRLEQLTVDINIGVAKVQAKIDRDAADDPIPTGAILGPIEDFFHEAATAIRDRGGAGLLLIIDEIHEPLEPDSNGSVSVSARRDMAILLNVIQNMAGERERYPLAIIGAGLPQTRTALTRAATFGERVGELVLTEFDANTSADALALPAGDVGVSWSPKALEMAVERAEGYPQALQLIGDAAWEEAAPDAGGEISLRDVEKSQAAVDRAMSAMFQARWDVATESERSFLRSMASLAGETVSRASIAAELAVNSADLGMVRRSLIQKGIIEPAGHGLLRFTIPGFDAFLREQ